MFAPLLDMTMRGEKREVGVLTSLLLHSWAATKREESKSGAKMERKRRIFVVLTDVGKYF